MFKTKISVEYKKDWSKDLMKKYETDMESLICQKLSENESLDLIKIKNSPKLNNLKNFFSKYKNVKDFKIIEKNNDYIFFKITSIGPSNINMFLKNSCYQLGPLLMKDGKEIWNIISTSKTNVQKLLKDLNDDIRIAEFISTERFDFEKGRLTDRQFSILKFLYDNGYFKLPKKITLEKASKILGISKSTLNKHLNKANKKVIEDFMKYPNAQKDGKGTHVCQKY